MAFDKNTRNRLASFVADARDVIADEFTEQFQSLYGISAKGEIAPLESLGHLDEGGMATAALLRQRIEYLEKSHPDDKDGIKAAVARLAREQAFTVLNRLAAIRMAEKRGLIVESVGQGYQSKGFKVFETVAGSALGDTYHRYRRYLFCLFDELAIDLGILFDRRSPQALLFPREPALLALLDLFHAADLERLWAEDETIGWIYQYYNDPEERKKMRAESAAPRNSRELAVRNQFFTPRYVVEFLTDNTLGRIWYEMTKGKTRLAEQCRYLVRRPTEVFLAEGKTAPETPDKEGLSQEELFKQPVHIPHRPLKDPREIRLLDPACGSMHFGLYAFDIFEVIYEEAWDKGFCTALQEAYPSKEEFLRDVPRLIIEHNIHGIDIDPRAVQIAGLSLWLRAQKAWQARGVKPADRPRVRRSNIVCAEPMPGSPEMLEEFIATLKPDLLGELVKTVFDKMQLAGEAGSLLKIEEEIRTAIDSARKEWLKQQDDLLTRKDGSQEEFFDTAEQQVIDALRAYAEQADADSYQRRLFADDAARGFAFIDLCRKRYDAVVMNPPFGASSVDSGKYIKASFKDAASDLYACFILRGLHLNIDSKGKVGAITNRTGFFIDQLADWRGSVVAKTESIADLGSGVLDALVEAAAYIVDSSDSSCRNGSLAFELLSEDDKGGALLEAIQGSQAGKSTQLSHFWSSKSLQAIPGSPLAYWVTQGLLHPFSGRPSLREAGFDAQIGVSTKDDFRFLRLRWETEIKKFRDKWFPLAKGGEYSRYWSDIYLVINFESEARELHAYIAHKYPYLNGNTSWVVHPESGYLRPGLTYTRRTSSPLSVRILPEGCVFSDMGRGIIHQSDNKAELMTLLGLANARVFRHFVELCVAAGDAAARTYEGGILNQMPSIAADPDLRRWATELALAKRSAFAADETTAFFTSPDPSRDLTDVVDLFEELQPKIEKACCGLLQLNDEDFETIDARTPEKGHVEAPSNWAAQNDSLVDLSYCLGTAFGRWDIRYATGERQPPELPDPFDPLPVCPPGMLQNAEGLPAEPKDVTADYPLRISWPGILVDDENHPEDIVARVREAIEVIWKDRAEAIEQEACGILGVKTLRDYFRRPAAFFADHLKRYSKSRRQAPIYWPLSTKSGSYTLWLYYHRLTDQTLHTCLADFLDPEIRKVQSELDALTASGGGGTRAGELREFLDELHDLRDEIERVIKLPWKPNLNDGVLITASPLHQLFRLPRWQNDLKACWDKLTKGDYDWAHLAYTIWPRRVEKACEKDRSIAIAHGLEHLCKTQPPKPKKKRGKKLVDDDAADDELALTEED
jgi:hypothetical protein